MKISEQRWPAQQAPDEFSDRVVQMGLEATSAEWAVIEPPPGRPPSRFFDFFGRAALGWSFAAAVTIGAVVVYFGMVKPEAEARRDAVEAQLNAALAALEEVSTTAREVDQLRAKVALLEAALSEARLAEASRFAKATVSLAAGGSPASSATSRAASSSRRACLCQPGDALCSCL